MDTIIISDLEVFFQVGVTEEERAQPQRLLISLELAHDFKAASNNDDLAETIDYYAVTQKLLHFGEGVHWALLETLAADIADMILEEYRPQSVIVEIKKFVIPEARHVAVRITRPGQP